MKTLLLIGSDKISQRFLSDFFPRKLKGKVLIAVNKAFSLKRIFSLLSKRRLSLKAFLHMLLAELIRPRTLKPNFKYEINSNRALQNFIKQHKVKQVFLFRAGLIISQETLDLGIPVYNVHCASLPQYAGLGSIYRALKDKAYQQEATFHVVNSKIDDGRTLDKQPYRLDPHKSYWQNENLAYEAGYQLLIRNLQKYNQK